MSSEIVQAMLPFAAPPSRRNLVIEAGAGTGKTTRIVAEVLDLLLGGRSILPERIVLMTFTEKAAGEIAARITAAVHEIAESEGGGAIAWPAGSPTPLLLWEGGVADARRAAARALIPALDRLRSQTIHSFCQRLLRLHPIEAGLDPEFRIVQGFERSRLVQEIYDSWLQHETVMSPAAGTTAEWEILYRHFDYLDSVREALIGLLPRRDLVADRSYSLGEVRDALPAIRAALEELRAWAEPETIRSEEAVAIIEYLRAAPAPAGDELEAWLEFLRPIARPVAEVHLSRVPRRLKESLRLLRGGEAKREKPNTVFHQFAAHRAALALRAVAIRFFEFLDREKERIGVVDFDDLLLRALGLLSNPAVLASVRRRYDHFFVDEFQDTDRVQARIIDLLARNHDGQLVPGRVTIVGDPKQSIYGFRRADPETYADTVRRMVVEGAEEHYLSEQYRSDAGLVDALNAMFVPLFPEQAAADQEVFRPHYKPLRAARAGSGRPPIRFLFVPEEEKQAAQRSEACAVASMIASRAAGGARFDRFAILLRRQTHLQSYLEALERRGIPFLVPPAGKLLEAPVIVDLLAVLRTIAFPFDGAGEVAALRSSIMALTDDEIAAWIAGERRTGASPRVDEARSMLAELRTAAHTLSVTRLIARIIDASGIEAALAATSRASALPQIERFRQIAERWEQSEGGSVRQFIDELLLRRIESDESEPRPADEQADAVRVMTVHASKGLEFDTVILPDLTPQGGRNGVEAFAVDGASLLAFRGRVASLSLDWSRAGGRTMREIGSAREEEENKRLFYVAVTRARTDVVFVCSERPSERGFWKCVAAAFGFERTAVEDACAAGGCVEATIEAPGGAIAVAFERAAEDDVPSRTRVAAPENFAGEGSIAGGMGEADRPAYGAGEIARLRASARKKGAGILLHRILERWDGSKETLTELGRKIGEEQGMPEESVREACRRIAALARSPQFEQLFAREAHREVTIHLRDREGRVVEKRIDRLIVTGEGAIVVDYKSGDPSAERLAIDREQVAGYMKAIAEIDGRPCRGLLWYVGDDRDEVVEVAAHEA